MSIKNLIKEGSKMRKKLIKINFSWVLLLTMGLSFGLLEKVYAAPQLTQELRSGGKMYLKWDVTTGATYTLKRAINIDLTNWNTDAAATVTTVYATYTGTISIYDTATGESGEEGAYYRYRLREEGGGGWSNITLGYLDRTIPESIDDLIITSQAQQKSIQLQWTAPLDPPFKATATPNGSQLYYMIYRKAKAGKLVNGEINNNNLLAVVKAINPHNNSALQQFTCYDANGTGTIRDTNWQYYSWVNSNMGVPEKATQYAYAVITVDTAGVWTTNTTTYYPLGTPGTPTGNVSEISGAGQATIDLKGIVSILDLTGVGTGSGGVGSITLNWSAATNTLGIGYYFEIHRKQLPGTLTQEFINTGNYLIGTTTDTSYEGSVTSGLWYSFATIIVDPSDGVEKSPISNDLVILGDWTPPEVNITNVTPTYTESPGTITVSFTYNELNPDKYIINIYNDEMGINSIGSFTSTLTIPNDGTLTITGTVTINGVDGTYSVKVTIIDEGDNEGESVWDSAVVVDVGEPVVTVNEPANNVYRKNNGTVTVYFTYSEPNPNTYSVRIYQGATEIGSETGNLTTPEGSKTVNIQVSGATDGTYSVQVKVTDKLNHAGYGTATGLVVLDNKAPEVEVTEPSVDVYRENGGTVSVTFSYSELNPATYTITIGTVGSAEGTLTTPDGQKTVDVQVSGADGTYSVSVTVTDKVNLSDSGTAPGTVTLDNKAPEINITSPLGGTIYTQTPATITVTFTYVEDNPATITVTIGTTTVIGSATGTPESAVVQILDGYGTASVYIPDPPTPANGTYNVKVVMSDRVGKTDEDEELGAVWVDNTVPGTITIVAVLTNGNEENITGTISVGGTVTIRATAQDDETGIDKVEFYWGDTGLDTSGTDSSPSKLGTHTIVWNATGNGIKDLFCIAYDQAGNTATSPAIVTVVDNQPPQINIISPTTQDKVYQRGEGTVTVVFTYTEVYPATLTITINSEIYGVLTQTTTTTPNIPSAPVPTQATYTLTFTNAGNKEGTYTVSVLMSDKSIGSTTDTEEEAVIIDDTPPQMTIVYPTENNLAYATNTDIIIVRFTYTEANPDIAVVYMGTSSSLFAGTNTNLPPGTGTTIGTVSLGFENLPEGTYSIRGYMMDKCGVGTWTDIIWGVVVLDDTPPIVEITDPTTLNKAYKKGTDSVVVTFSFTEKYPGTLTISIEGTTFSTQTVYPSTSTPAQIPTIGSLTLPFEGLGDSPYSLFIELQDKVGKIGTNSQTDALIIDNISPEVTIINPLGSYTTTPDNRVVIFTYTEQNPDFATITITGVATETVFATTTTTFYGNWGQGTITIPAGSGTLDGTYTVEVTLTDKIGNKDTDTKDEALTIDDTAPAMTIVYPTEYNLAYATGTGIIVPRFTYTEANPYQASVGMGTSAQAGYVCVGTTINLPPGDGTTIGTVSLDFANLQEGTYSVKGTMTDKCGLGTQTPVIWGVVVVDMTGPEVEIINPTTSNKAYKKGTDSVVVEFSFTEKYPGTLTIGIGTSTMEYSTQTVYPATTTIPSQPVKGSLTLPFYGLAEGTYTLFIELEDKVGVIGTNSQADAVIIDDSGPKVTIINPLGSYTTTPADRVVLFDYEDASPFAYATITISGIATVFSTVTTLKGRGTVSIPAGNGTLDGTYTVEVIAVDILGNVGNAYKESALTIDDTEPAMTIVYPTEYNLAYALGTDTIVPRFIYTEANPYGACVGIGTSTILFRGLNFNLPPGTGTTIGTVSLDFKDLPEGTYSVVGTMTDKCGLGTQTPVIWGVVVVDMTGPKVEIINPTTSNKAYKKGTDSVVVTFSFTEKYPGTLTIGIGTSTMEYSTQTVYPATTTIPSQPVKGSLTLPFYGLAEGTYTLFIELEDKVGAIGTNSQTDAVIIDDSGPKVTIINPLGSYTTTPVNRVVLFDYEDASPFAYATITISGIATTTLFSTVTTLKGRGTVSIPAGNGTLDGTYTVGVIAVDTPGNVGNAYKESALTIDDTKPAMTIVYPTENNLAYALGTDTIVPRFIYTEANPYGACVGIGTSTILFRGLNFNLPPGTGTTIGTVSLDFKDLPEGTYSVVGTMTDKCGLGTQTPVIWGVVVVDMTGPKVEIINPTTSNKAYKKGTDSVVVTFSFTEKYPGTLTIGIGTSTMEYSTQTVYPATTTIPSQPVKGSLTLPFYGLAEGTYTLFIELEDKVGAIGTNSQTDAVIIDDSGPKVTIINPLGSYTTTPVNRVVLFDYEDASPFAYATITISGIATTTLFSTVTTLKGRGTVSIPAGNGTLDGTYTVGVIAVDTPGNVGNAYKESALTIDDTKPNVTLLYPTNGNPFYGQADGTFTITFSFTEENYGTSVVIISTFDGTIQTTISTTVAEEIGIGSATFNYNTASEGTYSVKVEMRDIVNKLGTATQREAIIIDTTDPVLKMISPATVTYTMATDTVKVIFTYTEIHPGTITARLIGTSGAVSAFTLTTTLTPTGTNTSLQGTLTLQLNSVSDGTYSIQVEMIDKANNSTVTTHPDAVIIVDTILPEVTIISPTTNSPAYGTGTGSIKVVFTYTEANPEMATITIVGTGISTSTTNLVGGPGVHQGTVTLPFTGLSNVTYSLKIELSDIPGNVGSSTQQDALIIDAQPPIVTIISPTGYGTKTWACEGGKIEVVFSYTEQNPASFTITFAGPLGEIGSFTQIGNISPGTDCIRSEVVTLTNTIANEGTYTLTITMYDMLSVPGAAATKSALWIDTTNPETQGTGTDISSPAWGAMVPVEPGTISGVIGDGVTNPLWMSGVRKVVAYFIHAGENIPDDSPSGYPYASETDPAFLALNPIYIGSYIVSQTPAPAVATYSINWDPTTFPPGGFWIVTFVYDEAGNVYDPWLPGGIRDVTPPEQIRDVEGKSPQGTKDVVLDWTDNGVPYDNSGSICGYRIYAKSDDDDPYNPPPAAPDKNAVANFVPSGTYTVWRYLVNVEGRYWFWVAAVDEEIIYDGGDSVIETYPQIGYDDTFVASGTGSQPGATYTTIIEPGLNKYINSIPGDIDGDGDVEYPNTDDRGPNIAPLSPPVLVYINDMTPPPVVTKFNATMTTNSSVLLQGTQTTKNKKIDNDEMDYYLVYRKAQGTNLVDADLIDVNQIAQVDYNPVNITEDLPGTYTYHFQYIDSAVTVGQTYAYAVIAVDRTGNKSAISIGVNTVVTVLDTTPPQAITTLDAQPIAGSRTVKLTWLEPIDNVGVTLYTVYRATSPIYATSTAVFRGTTTATEYDDVGIASDEGKTFYYAVISEDAAGNESNISNSPFATVNDVTPPTPAFSYDPSSPKQDEDVTFDASRSNDNIGVVSYYWGFGDGATATGMVVTHRFAEKKTYTVTLEVKDAAGNGSSTSQDVVVGDSEKPVISGLANRKGNTGDMVSVPVTVTDNNEVATVTVHYSQDGNEYSTTTVGSGKNWNWTFTFTATDTSVSDIEYYVEASDYDGNTLVSGKWYIKITDNDDPTAAFSYDPSSPKQDEDVTFDASGSNDNIGVVSYYWGFGDGATATGRVVTHRFAEKKTYTVTLEVKDAARNGSLTSQNVVVGDSEKPVISGLGDRKGTTGDPVFVPVTVTDNNMVTSIILHYYQDGNEYSTSTVANVGTWTGTLTFTANNNSVGKIRYSIEARDDDGNISESSIREITITDDENPVAVFTYSPITPEQNQIVTFNAGSSTDNIKIVTYTWTFGDGDILSLPGWECTHRYTHIGTYTVKLEVQDNAGNKASTQTSIVVKDKETPVPHINCNNSGIDQNPKPVEEDAAVIFDGSKSTDNGIIKTYIWEFAGNGTQIVATTTSAITYSFANPGLYTVYLNVVDDNNNTSTVPASIQVTVVYKQLTKTQTIGANGGILGEVNDITLNIQAGALGANVEFKVEPASLAEIPNGFVGIAGTAYKITPKKLFNKEGTLTIWYADADQDGLVEECDINNFQKQPLKAEDLRIYYFDGYDWMMLPSVVNIASRTVMAKINHTGKFAIGIKDQGIAGRDVDPDTILANLVLTENPFAPSGSNFTEFHGDLGRDSYITVKIYDTTGEEVRELPRTLVTAGASRVLAIWDGRTNGGEITENGIYVYQIKVAQIGGRMKVETHAIGIVK
ncbi:MAG: PKD domain-containing protein [bacterium]